MYRSFPVPPSDNEKKNTFASPWVVLWDGLLHLAHQVGSHGGRLGVDAAPQLGKQWSTPANSLSVAPLLPGSTHGRRASRAGAQTGDR